MLLVVDKILGKATKEVTSGAVNFNLLPKLRCFQAGGQSLTSIELNGTSNIEKVHVDFTNLPALDLFLYINLNSVSSRFNNKLTAIFAKNGMSHDIHFLQMSSFEIYLC